MPWWSWVLIWSGLVVALIAMLVLFAIWLFRKAMTTAEALEDLASRADILAERGEELRPEPMASSVFDGTGAPGARVTDNRTRRAEARQRRRDSRIKQARLLAKADPAQFSHLSKRT